MAKKDGTVADPKGGASSLGDLLRAKGLAASATPTPPPVPPKVAPAGARLDGKLVVRRSKKGRGGKTATTIEGVTGRPAELEALVKKLKTSLGCGASLDEGVIVVQGDQPDRVEALLRQLGATRVVQG